jgi:hypothetical protein
MITDAHGVTFEPWLDGRVVGFKVAHPDGRREYRLRLLHLPGRGLLTHQRRPDALGRRLVLPLAGVGLPLAARLPGEPDPAGVRVADRTGYVEAPHRKNQTKRAMIWPPRIFM